MTEIVLPKELKVIVNSFNYFLNVKFEIPQGVEVIVNSFWAVSYHYGETRGDMYIDYDKGTSVNSIGQRYGYSYDIALPDSVVNLSQVPNNFTFSATSAFYKDAEKRIFKKDERGLILICDYNVFENGTLTVPDGVAGIQVGAFFHMPWVKYIRLPASWNFISYNAEVENYPYYYFKTATSTSYTVCWLYSNTMKDNLAGLNVAATQIYNNFDGKLYGSINPGDGKQYKNEAVFERVMVNGTTLPEGVWTNVFGGDYTTAENFGKVCFVGEVPAGQDVTIYLITKNTQVNSTALKSIKTVSGSDFTMDDLLAKAGIGSDKCITAVTQFGEEYTFAGKVKSSLYLDISYEYNPCGYDYEEKNGEIVITKFNEEKAGTLDNGYLIVNIPDTINGKPVTEIAANAFAGVEAISHVFIPASVKKIGDAAFQNCASLTTVKIAYGGLEYLGRSAFEGCAMTSIHLPLDKLTYVGPYALKIKTLNTILALQPDGTAKQETIQCSEWMKINMPDSYEEPDLTVGKYYATGFTLVKYMGKSTGKQWNYAKIEQVDVDVYDFQLYAVAPDFAIWYSYGMGLSGRSEAGMMRTTDVVRYEVMEGSVYYLGALRKEKDKKPLIFGIISKVHKNAFTDMDSGFFLTLTEKTKTDEQGNTVSYYESKLCYYHGSSEELDRDDCWLTAEQVQTMDPPVFEEGWWEGWTEQTDPENYAKLKAAMEHSGLYARRCFTT